MQPTLLQWIPFNMTESLVLLTFPYMPARILNGWVAIYIWQLSQAKPVRVVARICKAIYYDDICLTVEHLADPAVQLIVCDVGPIEWFLKHRQVCDWTQSMQQAKVIQWPAVNSLQWSLNYLQQWREEECIKNTDGKARRKETNRKTKM
jgi:hypothetical protein